MKDTRSFFEKLTGAVRIPEETEHDFDYDTPMNTPVKKISPSRQSTSISNDWLEEEQEEGQLTVDVYQDTNNIVIKCMVAGVKPEDLEITMTRDMVTIKGRRETEKSIQDEDYFHQELYWGSFSRTITLPAEVNIEEAEAVEKHGLLIIKLPKIDKNRQARLKVKGN